MVSAFYILHATDLDLEYLNSEVLLNRVFYDDLPDTKLVIDTFDTVYRRQLPEQRTPFICYKGLNYIYIKEDNGIFLLLVTRRNVDTMLMILFLHHFQGLLKYYLCYANDTYNQELSFDKEVVMDNVYFIYELLDECMDQGIIQMTDYNILKEYIKIMPNRPVLNLHSEDTYFLSSSDSDSDSDSNVAANSDSTHNKEQSNNKKTKSKRKKVKASRKEFAGVKSTKNQAIKTDAITVDETQVNSSILRASSLSINWRPKGIFYAKNEIYIDMIENCEFHFDLQENVILRNEVFGNCFIKCYLSGMPICVVGFNETRISKIDNDDSSKDQDLGNDPELRKGNQLKVEQFDDDDDYNNYDSNANDDNDNITENTESNDNELAESVKLQESKRHIPFRNIQFHQCVELDSIYKNNLMKFIPPDDKFILMSYQIEQQRQRRKLPLIMIKPTYRIKREAHKLQVLVILSTNFKKRLHGKNLMVKIPINPLLFQVIIDDEENSLKYKTEVGDVSYQVDSSELIWNLDNFAGNNPSIKMMAELSVNSNIEQLTPEKIAITLQNRTSAKQVDSNNTTYTTYDDNEEAKRELDRYYGVNGSKSTLIEEIQKNLTMIKSFNHVKMSFNIPMLSYSGLRVNYLKVDEPHLKYTCFPWVRYVTQSDKVNLSLFSSTPKSNCTYRFKLGLNCFTFE